MFVESNHFPNSYVRRYSFILYRGEYKIRTCVKGFADLRMTTLPTRLICSFIRTRTQSKMSVAFRANPLHYEANLHGLRDSNSHQKFWRLTCCRCTKPAIVGIERLELSTFRVSGECSNQLSYIPICRRSRIRTYGLHVPNVARYLATLFSEL